jgi:hypothetical protein
MGRESARGGNVSAQQSVEFFVAIQSLVIGLSHIMQPRAWVDFFIWLRGKGHAGVFANGFLGLWFGSLIVAFHPIWSGPEIVVTLLGWAQILKAALAFVLPSVSIRGLDRVSVDRSQEFVAAGVGLLAISGVCWYLVLARGVAP